MFRFLRNMLTAVLILTGGLWATDVYHADKAHTTVGFSVKHMVITTVSGKFKDFTCTFNFDESDPGKSSIEATIQVASVDTDNEKRDGHLRSPSFFDAENFPEILFLSKSISRENDHYVATGDLTIRGVTRTINLPFELTGPIQDPRGNTRLGAEASLTINRQDFGVSWNKTLDTGGLVVSDEVKIQINAEFIRQK